MGQEAHQVPRAAVFESPEASRRGCQIRGALGQEARKVPRAAVFESPEAFRRGCQIRGMWARRGPGRKYVNLQREAKGKR